MGAVCPRRRTLEEEDFDRYFQSLAEGPFLNEEERRSFLNEEERRLRFQELRRRWGPFVEPERLERVQTATDDY